MACLRDYLRVTIKRAYPSALVHSELAGMGRNTPLADTRVVVF
jgi:hypothetical protein